MARSEAKPVEVTSVGSGSSQNGSDSASGGGEGQSEAGCLVRVSK